MSAPRRMRGTASDLVVSVWRLLAEGREDEARATMLRTWSVAVDALAGEQAVHVALRLLERLAPSTDDPEGWARLPDEIPVFRAGMLEGFAWTTERDVAEALARKLRAEWSEAVPIHLGTVAKRHVLAYITGYGEHELAVRWECVNVTKTLAGARTVPTPVPPQR